MGIEDAIREQHAFKDRLTQFLSLAASMTDRELEIALGRLADLLGQSRNETDTLDIRLKGEALKIYYNLRLSREKRQSRIARIRASVCAGVYISPDFGERLIEQLASFSLAPRVPLPVSGKGNPAPFDQTIKLLAP